MATESTDHPEIGVRRLAAADCALVHHLDLVCRGGAAAFRGADVLLDEVPPVADWEALVDDDRHPVWVGTVDGTAVGFLAAHLTDGVLSVQQVFVHPDARELGLGDDLLAAALDLARSAGCRRLEGSALPGDRLTKNLYERAGITARKIVLSTALD